MLVQLASVMPSREGIALVRTANSATTLLPQMGTLMLSPASTAAQQEVLAMPSREDSVTAELLADILTTEGFRLHMEYSKLLTVQAVEVVVVSAMPSREAIVTVVRPADSVTETHSLPLVTIEDPEEMVSVLPFKEVIVIVASLADSPTRLAESLQHRASRRLATRFRAAQDANTEMRANSRTMHPLKLLRLSSKFGRYVWHRE